MYNHTSLRIGTIFLGYSVISIGVSLYAIFWPQADVKEESMGDSLIDNATEMGTDEQKVKNIVRFTDFLATRTSSTKNRFYNLGKGKNYIKFYIIIFFQDEII